MLKIQKLVIMRHK